MRKPQKKKKNWCQPLCRRTRRRHEQKRLGGMLGNTIGGSSFRRPVFYLFVYFYGGLGGTNHPNAIVVSLGVSSCPLTTAIPRVMCLSCTSRRRRPKRILRRCRRRKRCCDAFPSTLSPIPIPKAICPNPPRVRKNRAMILNLPWSWPRLFGKRGAAAVGLLMRMVQVGSCRFGRFVPPNDGAVSLHDISHHFNC